MLLSSVKLVMLDEVHLIGERERGGTLELVMKFCPYVRRDKFCPYALRDKILSLVGTKFCP